MLVVDSGDILRPVWNLEPHMLQISSSRTGAMNLRAHVAFLVRSPVGSNRVSSLLRYPIPVPGTHIPVRCLFLGSGRP